MFVSASSVNILSPTAGVDVLVKLGNLKLEPLIITVSVLVSPKVTKPSTVKVPSTNRLFVPGSLVPPT